MIFLFDVQLRNKYYDDDDDAMFVLEDRYNSVFGFSSFHDWSARIERPAGLFLMR